MVASAYHLRVTIPGHPEATRRNLTEGNLIAHDLDHSAAKRYGQAADILAQRYTALEAANAGIAWDCARYLKPIGEEDNTLVGQHERALVANETARSNRIDPPARGKGKQTGWNYPPPGKGKGKWNPFADQDGPQAEDWQWPALRDDQGQKGSTAKGKGKDKGKTHRVRFVEGDTH